MKQKNLTSFFFVVFSILILVGLVSAFQITGNVVSVSSSGTATISSTSQDCPQYTPPAPGWCEGGKITPGTIDENGCQGHPKCTMPTSQDCPQYTPPAPGWCEGGKITPGTIDENGCQGHPKCTMPTSQEKPIEVEVSTSSGSSTKVSIGKISENSISIKEGSSSVETSEGVVIRDKKLFMDSSQGEKEIKVMPSTTSEVAINQLKLKDYSIELKDVGKPVYEITGKTNVKVLGFIRAEMTIKSQVSAETGEVEKINKPWWSFLAKEE